MKQKIWFGLFSLVVFAVPNLFAGQVAFASETNMTNIRLISRQGNNAPTIYAKDRTIYIGDNFDPLEGVGFYDKEDGSRYPTKENIIYNDVNTNVLGIYTVTYAVEDSDNNRTEKSISVAVVERNADIVFPHNSIVISQYSQFNPLPQLLGITSHNSQGLDTTDSLFILENNVDTSKIGSYKVVYCLPSMHGDPVVIKELSISVVRIM